MEKKTVYEQPRSARQTSLQGQSPLSIHRAFVVQFRMETHVEKGPVIGRVEHVASGQVSFFDSFEELVAFFGRILGQGTDAPGLESDESKP